tara:strand:- start:687 stop:929 length:243 start_codon:yes stop_codon:yes gene_type:complete
MQMINKGSTNGEKLIAPLPHTPKENGKKRRYYVDNLPPPLIANFEVEDGISLGTQVERLLHSVWQGRYPHLVLLQLWYMT